MSSETKAKRIESENHPFEINKAEIVFLISEAICILFYGLFTEFNEYNTPKVTPENNTKAL
jgi:hypothetical protein